MGSARDRIKRVREAHEHVEELVSRPETTFIIHYSCESFYDRADGATPRITSIAIRNYSNGQTHSFSIHKVAEVTGTPAGAITVSYDRLERATLDEFFEFVRLHQTNQWVHWNMRDINYGFPAIEHRYRVLGGTPVVIDDSRKHDLARLLSAMYGLRYIGHPRLESLVDKNSITRLDFLSGKEEADAFEAGEYVRLHQSTLRKVDVLATILERAADGSLKTNSGWFDRHGYSPAAVGELVKDHWGFALFAVLASIASIVGLYYTLRPR
ncbi:MAG: hypothetical protein JWM41_3395 [Gemmatimonadetes bacterium]|nr:hypothetical protein [Gemmatimonadota bacterium]